MKAFTVSMLLLAVALALYTEPVQAQGPTDSVNLAAQVSTRVLVSMRVRSDDVAAVERHSSAVF